jgi:ATP-binding cassette subfamily B protein
MLMQDFGIYHLTLGENIGIGEITKIADIERIKATTQALGINEFVERLPQAYNTYIGRFIEAGHSLSGGQEQMIALARCTFKDAPILVLDEPTAALDAQHSLLFFEKVLNPIICSTRATVLISHTFKAITRCNRILYLEGGKIIEEGSHAGLLAANGKYAGDFQMNLLERT